MKVASERKFIRGIPNTGPKNLCHMTCAHMVLQYHGENMLLCRFIPLSGFTFGSLYVNDGKFIYPWTCACPCLDAMCFMAEQLGYNYEVITGDWDLAWSQVKAFIDQGKPIVAGPLPINFYAYNPRVDPTIAWDSFCVICGYDKENVIIHDDFGLNYVSQSLEVLKTSWMEGAKICPVISRTPFFFVVKDKVRSYEELYVLQNSLKRIQELVRGKEFSESKWGGLIGEKRLAQDIKSLFGLPKTRKLAAVLTLIQNMFFHLGNTGRSDNASLFHYYADKVPEEGDKQKLLMLARIYEEEASLYLEGMYKTRSTIQKLNEEESGVESQARGLSEVVNRIIKKDERAIETIQTML